MGYTVKTDLGYGTAYIATYATYDDALRHALAVQHAADPGERVSIVQRVTAFRDNTVTVL